jgi:hypothetical protein
MLEKSFSEPKTLLVAHRSGCATEPAQMTGSKAPRRRERLKPYPCRGCLKSPGRS